MAVQLARRYSRNRKGLVFGAVLLSAAGAFTWDLWHGLRSARLRALLTCAVFPERVEVSRGEPIDPDSILVAVDVTAKKAWLGGAPVPFGEIRKRFPREESPPPPSWLPGFLRSFLYPEAGELKFYKDPVLIEARPGAVFREMGALFEATLCNAWSNISFLVRSPEADRSVTIPFPCNGPSIARGKHRMPLESKDRLWIIAEVGSGGRFVVKGFRQGPDRDWMVAFINGEPERPIREREWRGDHPPTGPWSMEILRSFLRDPGVSALDPIIALKVAGVETVSDVLRCLDDLHPVAGDRTLAEIDWLWP